MSNAGWFAAGVVAGAVAIRAADVYRLVHESHEIIMGLVDDPADAEEDEDLEEHFANWRRELDEDE